MRMSQKTAMLSPPTQRRSGNRGDGRLGVAEQLGVCAQTQFAVQKAGVIGERGLPLKVQSRAEPFIAAGDDDHRHLVVVPALGC